MSGHWYGVAEHQWIYKRQKQICYQGWYDRGVFYERRHFDTGRRRDKALRWGDGQDRSATKSIWACPKNWYKTTVLGTISITKCKTHRWNGWFSVAGAKLDITQTEGTETNFTITSVNDRTRMAICGLNAEPGSAELLREIPWSQRPVA